MDAGEAYHLARVYSLEYVEAKLKVWQTLLGLGDGDAGGSQVIRPTVKNPIGYLHTILTRDIELPTPITPLSRVAAPPLRRLANPTANNNDYNDNNGSRWYTNNNPKRVVASRSTGGSGNGKDRLATTKAFLARYDEAADASNLNTTITPSIPANYDKDDDTATNDEDDANNKDKPSLFTATRVNAPCKIPKATFEGTRLDLEPVWQELLKEDLVWGHNRLKSDKLDLLIGSQLLLGSPLELEQGENDDEEDHTGQTVGQAQSILQLTLKLSQGEAEAGWQAERLSLTSRSAIKLAIRQKLGRSFALTFT